MKTWGHQRRGSVNPPPPDKSSTEYIQLFFIPSSLAREKEKAQERVFEGESAENEEKKKEKVDELGEEGHAGGGGGKKQMAWQQLQ